MKFDSENNAELSDIFGSGNYFALLKAAPLRSQTGSTWTEVTTGDHGSYARQGVGSSMGTPANGDVANTSAITFPAGTSGTLAEAYFVAIASAVTAGTAKAAYPIHGGNAPKPIVSITRVGTTASVVCTGHGYSNGDRVWISGATLDAYNIVATISNVTTNGFDYTVSGSPATPAVAEFGALRAQKLSPVPIGLNTTPTIAIGAFTPSER